MKIEKHSCSFRSGHWPINGILCQKPGFTVRHHYEGLAIVVRDKVEIHLWKSRDSDTVAEAQPLLLISFLFITLSI